MTKNFVNFHIIYILVIILVLTTNTLIVLNYEDKKWNNVNKMTWTKLLILWKVLQRMHCHFFVAIISMEVINVCFWRRLQKRTKVQNEPNLFSCLLLMFSIVWVILNFHNKRRFHSMHTLLSFILLTLINLRVNKEKYNFCQIN